MYVFKKLIYYYFTQILKCSAINQTPNRYRLAFTRNIKTIIKYDFKI